MKKLKTTNFLDHINEKVKKTTKGVNVIKKITCC